MTNYLDLFNDFLESTSCAGGRNSIGVPFLLVTCDIYEIDEGRTHSEEEVQLFFFEDHLRHMAECDNLDQSTKPQTVEHCFLVTNHRVFEVESSRVINGTIHTIFKLTTEYTEDQLKGLMML